MCVRCLDQGSHCLAGPVVSMALNNALRQLAQLSRSSQGSQAILGRWLPSSTSAARGYASEEALSRKEVVYLLDNRDDPETDAGIKAFMKQAFADATKPAAEAPAAADDDLELTTKIEKKYIAAQVVESGIQNISVPMSWDKEGKASLKRYVAQLLDVGKKAGFEDTASELRKKLADNAVLADSVKEFLNKAKAYMSPDFHTALVEALNEIEAKTGTVTFKASSPGYKAFSDKLKALAQAHKIPWQLLVASQAGAADEVTADSLARDYQSWLQSAHLQDAAAEISELQAEATRLLDVHLSKTAEQVRKEQEAALAALTRKLDAAKGARWAAQYQEDLKYLSWFDSKVAADPRSGPVAK